MEDCIFCKIVRGDIATPKTFEDETTIAFHDINPKTPGHTLLIPKTHHQWFQDMPDDVSDMLFRAAKKVANQLKDQYAADYIRVGIVGTDIPHVHIHLFPQKIADKNIIIA
jgi:histidine triad (HIT) family protein